MELNEYQYNVVSPTRVDLAGGTLDLWPLWTILGHATTINASISIYTTSRLQPREDAEVHIHSLDFKESWSFSCLDELLQSDDSRLRLYQCHLDFWRPKQGFHLQTGSESPVGGGLGGSSSLSVSMFQCFSQWLDSQPRDLNHVVNTCSNIEARLLKTPTGLQDYIPAAQPGLNVIRWKDSGFEAKALSTQLDFFNAHLFLVDTGKSHHSGLNNWDVYKRFIEGDEKVRGHLRAIRDISEEVRVACENENWSTVLELMNKEHEHRLGLSPGFSSPEIERLQAMTLENGALSFKICGAGGGGCVLVGADRSKRAELIALVEKSGFRVLPINFVG